MFFIPWDFKLNLESLPRSLTCSANLQNNCVKNTSVETVFSTLLSHSHLLYLVYSIYKGYFYIKYFFLGTREIFSWRLHTCLESCYLTDLIHWRQDTAQWVWWLGYELDGQGFVVWFLAQACKFFFPPLGMPRLALGPTQSHIQWIAQAKWSGHEAANSPSSSVS
jgi:hypothetical protein